MGKLTPRGLLITLVIAAAAVLTLLAVRDPDFRRRHLSLAPQEKPRELVAGMQGLRQPRASAADEHINLSALESAAAYAEAHDSSALIVGRHGHVVFERYWKGAGWDSVVDSGAFGRTVAAVMVGVAMDDRRIPSIDDPVSLYLGESGNVSQHGKTIRDLLEGDDAQPLVAIVERAIGDRYAKYVSRGLWKPLAAENAWLVLDRPQGAARADCCFFARQGDWMRLAQLLLGDGVYQGSRLLPPGWAGQMLAPSRHDPRVGFQVWRGTPRDGVYLKGSGGDRLWLVPALSLAVLRFGSDAKGWDEGRIPGIVVAGVEDRPATPKSTQTDLSTLVPHH